jgi:hypothetical protein
MTPLIGLDEPLIGEWIEAHALPDEGTEQVRWSYDWTLMELDDP